MACLRLVVLVGLAGCGRIDFDPVARLQKRAYEIEGVQKYAYTFDLLREEKCEPLRWTDGRTRCTPSASTLYYADASCSQPISLAAEPGGYHSELTTTESDTTLRRLWRATEELDISEYYAVGNGQCLGPNPVSATARGLEEVAPSDLVEMVVVEPDPSGRLVQQYAQEPGGIRLALSVVRDTQLGFLCYAGGSGIAAPSYPCHPAFQIGLEPSEYFDEPTCTSRVAAYGVNLPVRYFMMDSDRCSNTADTLHENLGLSPSALLYQNNPTCMSVGTYTGMILRLGPALDVPVFERSIVPGPGRIGTTVYSTGAITTEPHDLWDTQWNVACSPQGPDESIECRPYAGFLQTVYNDAACTDAISVTGVSACGSPDIPTLVTQAGELREVGPEIVTPVYRNQSGCVAAPSSVRFFSVGPVAAFTPATGRVVVVP